MSFKDEVWNTREATLGDIAETAFEHNYGPNSGWQWERYGLNRPRVSMFNIDPFVRYTPDYLLEGPDGTVRLVEVQGCGRDGLFKFKDDKIDALLDWHYQTNERGEVVHVWLWDEIHSRCWLVPIFGLIKLLEKHGQPGQFPEGKPYIAIHIEHLD